MKVLLLTIATMLGLSAVLLPPALSVSVAQTTAASMPGAALGPSDTYFVSQTSLGNQGDDPSHSELCGLNGEFPHQREQRTVGDTEE